MPRQEVRKVRISCRKIISLGRPEQRDLRKTTWSNYRLAFYWAFHYIPRMRKFILVLVATLCLPTFADPRVDVLDPGILRHLDQPGRFSLATVLGADAAEASQIRANSATLGHLQLLRLNEFYSVSADRYRQIADTARADIEEVIRQSGERNVAFSSENAEVLAPDGKVPRHFDYYWFNSADAAFVLVAVINRVDKKDFYPGTCGEVRFIYRIAYTRGNTRSTMPMFLNVVYEYPQDASGRCESVARLWSDPSVEPSDTKDGALMARDLERLPLDKSRIRFKQVELNMQILRYPSELKDDFGGQAAYLFRIFQDIGGKLQPIPLENTLDVAAISADANLRAALVNQLKDVGNLAKIDDGTFVLDNTDGRLLAKRALSFTTTGRARMANKPFTAALGPNPPELARVNFATAKLIKTPAGMIERLNTTSCMGCHQSGGTAGFHMLGRGGSLSTGFNLVILPFSPHYGIERTRRRDYTSALAASGTPDTFRALPFLPMGKGKTRDFCLPARQTDFAITAPCGTGNKCVVTASNPALGIRVGECAADNPVAGHVCRTGEVTDAPMKMSLGDLYNLRALRDTINGRKISSIPRCTVPEQGVPLGRIPEKCDPDSVDGRLEFVDNLASASRKPEKMCVVQGGDQFDECARSADPPGCLENAVIKRAYLDTCSRTHYCREDYICQQLPDGVARQYKGKTRALVARRLEKLANMGVGFCVPNYFVFNMRADGHILPETRPK